VRHQEEWLPLSLCANSLRDTIEIRIRNTYSMPERGGSMKKILSKTFIRTMSLAASAVVYSHAIFGIGGQWAPSPGLEVKASSGTLISSGTNVITLNQAKVSGLQGFGLKLWVDALPFIDIEAGSNVQFGYYDVNIISPNVTTPSKMDTTALAFDLNVPLVQGKPVFARIVNDVTILYPFLKFPPLVSIVKLYAGAGITQVIATSVLNKEFSDNALAKDAGSPAAVTSKNYTGAQVVDLLQKEIISEGLKSGIGFHLELGAKAKVPVIPIAIYADGKYHFLGSMPSAVDANSLTFELGAALAF